MRKTITIFLLAFSSIFLFTGYTPVFSQPAGTEIPAEMPEEKPVANIDIDGDVLLDGVPLDEFSEAADSLQRLLDQINALNEVPGKASEIIAFYPVIKDGLVTFVKQVRKPDSADDVAFMIELITEYSRVIAPLLLYFITFGFRMVKKSPKAVLTAFGKILTFIRTRYFIISLGVVLSVLWAIFFRDESFTVLGFIIFFGGTVLKGVGFNEALKWIQGIFKKEDAVPAKA